VRPFVAASAFVVACLPFALEFAGRSAWTLAPSSLLCWTALVWCTALSFVGRAESAARPMVVVAALLPLLALAASADLRAGDERADVVVHAACVLGVFGAWCVALERAHRSDRGATLALAVWGVVVLGAPLLVAVLTWGAADEAASAGAWLAASSKASPLARSYDLAARRLASGWSGLPWAPIGVAALLFGAGAYCEREARR
jgi:hypothetical protein